MAMITKVASALLLGLNLCLTPMAQQVSTPASVTAPLATQTPAPGNGTDKTTIEFTFNIPIPIAENNSTNCPAACLATQYGLCNSYNYDCFCDQARMDSVNCCMRDCVDDEANVRGVEAYLDAIHDQCLEQANLALAWPPICPGCHSCAPTPTPPPPPPPPCSNSPGPCAPTPNNNSTVPPAPGPKTDGATAISTNMWQYLGSMLAFTIVIANY